MNATPTTGRAAAKPVFSALCLALSIALYATTPTAHAQTAQQAQAQRQYDIPAGPLSRALGAWGTQSDEQLVFPPDLVAGKTSRAVSGRYAAGEALGRLLQGSGVAWERKGNTYVLKPAPAPTPALPPAPKPRSAPPPQDSEAAVQNMPAIMVTGAKTLNMDIMRTEDDPQPYVVFDREQIERSGATSLEQFLQQRLTMNTNIVNTGGNGISTSQITLRGLSAAQTLVLIDGHRVSSPGFSNDIGPGALSQTDITGIPLAAIERIEVLPTTASGIYGGSATGGVINIILRRDFTGAEVKLTYGNTFNTDVATRKIDFVFGHSFNDGRTSLLVSANYSDANDLRVGDRDLVQRGRSAIRNNNPSWLLPPSTPPLGATTNIRSSDGSNLILDDGTELNSPLTSVPKNYPGPNIDDGHGLLLNAGTYNWELAKTAQIGVGGIGQRVALYSQPTVKSGAVVLRHQFNYGLQIFADMSSSDTVNRFPIGASINGYLIPGESPNNPFVQDIRVMAPLPGSDSHITTTIEHHRALLGMIKQLQKGWQLGADYTWDRTNTTFGSGPVAPGFVSAVTAGEVDILRDTNAFPIDIGPYSVQGNRTSPFQSTMTDANLRVSGPAWQFESGQAMLSAMLAHRNESVGDSFYFFPTNDFTIFYPNRKQSVSSAYLELRVPIFSDKNARTALRELELQLAVRRDRYTSVSGEQLSIRGELPSPLPDVVHGRNEFTSVDPTIALRWRPIEDLTVRASYGTGFLPPALNQLVPTIQPIPGSSSDPLRGNTPVSYTWITGGNSDLKPEQSKSWSAGLILAPRFWPNFRVSIDYTRIEKVDNIGFHPGGTQGIINDESLFPGRVTRGPNLPDDPPGWAGPITQVNSGYLNLARAELEAWDARLDIKKELDRNGVVDFFFMGTWQPHYRTQLLQGHPVIENAGISSSSPLKFKANAGITWTHAAWQIGWNISHFGSYRVNDDLSDVTDQGGDGKVSSQTYNDMFARYDFGLREGNSRRFLSGAEIQVGIRNIFNKRPPLDAAGSYLYSPFGDPRLSSWYLSIKSSF